MGFQYAPSQACGAGARYPPRFPAYFPSAAPPVAPARPTPAPPRQRPRLTCAVWPEIAGRAPYESLRDLAAEYGVSHETIRTIARRMSGCRAAA